MDGSPQRHGQLERDSATMTDTTDEESVEATQPEDLDDTGAGDLSVEVTQAKDLGDTGADSKPVAPAAEPTRQGAGTSCRNTERRPGGSGRLHVQGGSLNKNLAIS